MRPSKPLLIEHIYRTEFGPGILSFREILTEAAGPVLGISQADAELYAEANRRACWNYLLKREDANVRRGLSPAFEVVNDNDGLMRWYPDVHGGAKDSRRTARLKHRPAILRTLDAITDREYEALGCVVSEVIGASHVHLTPKSKEGGVDFFALVIAPSPCHLLLGTTAPLRIVGQSKKYATAVEDEKVKSFITTLSDVHRLSPTVEPHVPTWFRAAAGPVIGWVMAHHGLQSGAASRARNHGIIYSDSLDVAEILALSRRIPEGLSAAERSLTIRKRIQDVSARLPS